MTRKAPPAVGTPGTAAERSSVGQTVLTFLESVGRPAEAQLYLKLFRSLPRGHFAAVVPTRTVLDESLGTLAEQLAFLTHLGLYPSLVLGATGAVSQRDAEELIDSLADLGVAASNTTADVATAADSAERLAASRTLPVFSLDDSSDQSLAALTVALQPRKVIVLRGAGGLGPHGAGALELAPGHVLETHQSGISAINLRSDLEALLASGTVSALDATWLQRIERLLQMTALGGLNSTTVSVASPLSLLRELFTVRGEGTLLKLGSVIERAVSAQDYDQGRLEHLLEESFGRPVKPEFWKRPPSRLYLEHDYRGVALLEDGDEAAFLSKFAVLPVARGEGLGQELWREMTKETPRLYWRSRASNPINGWYSTVCDGLHRGPRWHVYWRGIEPARVPGLIAEATERPADFLEA